MPYSELTSAGVTFGCTVSILSFTAPPPASSAAMMSRLRLSASSWRPSRLSVNTKL